MSLDATGFSNAVHVGVHDCDDPHNHIETFAYADFPDSFRGLAADHGFVWFR